MKKSLVLVGVLLLGLLPASRSAGEARVLTLDEALDMAVDASTTVGVYRQRLYTARQDVLVTHGRFLPNFTAGFRAGHSFQGPTGSIFIDAQGRPVTPSGFDYESYAFSINTQMNIFDWGTNLKYLESAKRSSDAAVNDLHYQKDVVTAQVIRAYYDVVRQKNLKLVQEEAVEAAQKNLDQVEAFFKIGSNTRADVLTAKVRLGNTRLQYISARNAEDLARATLSSLLNLPMEEEIDVESSLEITKIEPDLEREIAYALDHRSDLEASRFRLQAAQSSLTATENSRWPDLTGFMSYQWSDREFPANAPYFFDSEYAWGLGVSLNWDIFDRFQTKGDVQRAKAQQRIAEEELKQAKLDAVLEVKQLYLILSEAEERISVAQETVAQAEENVRLAEERYRVGAGTQLETIEAAAGLQEAQGSLVDATCDYLTAKADLLRATGRTAYSE